MEKALDGMGQKNIILEAEVKVLKLKCDNTYKKTAAEGKDDFSETAGLLTQSKERFPLLLTAPAYLPYLNGLKI